MKGQTALLILVIIVGALVGIVFLNTENVINVNTFNITNNFTTGDLENLTVDRLYVSHFTSLNHTINVTTFQDESFIINMTDTQYAIIMRRSDTGNARILFQNPVTNFGTSDGTLLGILSGGEFRVSQQENQPLSLQTNGLTRMLIDRSGNITLAQNLQVNGTGTSSFLGELSIAGISGDGTGQVVCIKSDSNLGTCTSTVGVTGACTCV